MCYSAKVVQDLQSYQRHFGAVPDLPQIASIYSQRLNVAAVRIPRGFDRNFDHPGDADAQVIKQSIDSYRNREAVRIEGELFALKKRQADAVRKLAIKSTKIALNERRIATDKLAKALARLPLLTGTQPHALDSRIFPMHYTPVVIADQGRLLVRLARYHLRQASKPAAIDGKFPGLYNARRDNLEKFWRNEFGHSHAMLLVESFYENVQRDGQNAVLHFVPRPEQPMCIACLAGHWQDDKGGELLSIAAVTDEPPPEVQAAGHDRMIVNLRPEHVSAWLHPQGQSTQQLQTLLEDRQQAYYQHQVLAA
jgi:putative SOS response-associated peptidase YedK